MARNELFLLAPDDVLVLDVQADLLASLNTRIIVPLLPRSKAPAPAKFLNPEFTWDGREYVMATQYLSAVSAFQLGKPVGSLDEHFAKITQALDTLFQGF